MLRILAGKFSLANHVERHNRAMFAVRSAFRSRACAAKHLAALYDTVEHAGMAGRAHQIYRMDRSAGDVGWVGRGDVGNAQVLFSGSCECSLIGCRLTCVHGLELPLFSVCLSGVCVTLSTS